MNLLKQNKVKLVVDIILIVGLIFTRIPFAHAPLWISPHCIIAGFWLLFTCLHLYQHWGLTKKLFKKRVVMKQKWTALTLSIFLLTCVSIVLLLFPTNLNKFHHILSEIYWCHQLNCIGMNKRSQEESIKLKTIKFRWKESSCIVNRTSITIIHKP